MVQTYQSPVRVYKYPFELVMAAYEKRFPTCEMIPVFLGSDIIFEHQDDDGATHVVERRCRLNVEVPYLLKKISGIEHAIFIQKNSLNRKNRKLVIEARNESFNTRVIIRETCTYSVHPENEQWTCFEQEASLDVKSFFGFEATVEKIAMKQYSANISKGKEIIEHFINELADEGVTEVPPWQPGVVGKLYASDAERAVMLESSTVPDVVTATPVEAAAAAAEATSTAAAEARRRSSTPKAEPTTPDDSDDDGFVDAESFAVDDDAATGVAAAAAGGEPVVGASKEEGGKLARSKSAGSRPKSPDADGDRVTPPVPASKLDSDYIERFLGQLSITQESCLVQLRNRLAETHKGKMPNDAHLLRFLRARDFNVEKARDMICHSIAWRKQHRVDNILNTYSSPEVMKFFPGGWHNNDKLGRPLYILRLGLMDVKGLMKSVGGEGILRHIVSIAEDGLRHCEKATHHAKSRGPISTFTCVVDLEGLSMRHLWRPGVKALLRIIEVMEANYPETLGRLIILRAPRVFPVLWTLVHPFIDEKTREKFVISTIVSHGINEVVEPDQVPDFLGGPARSDIPAGGLVPRSYYHFHAHDFDAEQDKETPTLFGEENIYKRASLVKGFPHEVAIQVADKGSVLTWDFDVLKGEISFAVFHCKKELSSPTENEAEPQGCVPMAATTGSLMDGGLPGEGAAQLVPKDWVVGRDLVAAENPVVYRDGDSVQGSHVAVKAGSYILQWKWIEGSSKPSTNLIDFPTFPHKSRLMYYTELLKSEDFKGSLSSLQSLQCSSVSLTTSTSGVSVAASSSSTSCSSR